MSVMVDTMVLVFASSGPGKKGAAFTEERTAVNALMLSLPGVLVSSVAWMEFTRGLRDGERDTREFQALVRKIAVREFDGPMADEAAQLMRSLRGQPSRCTKCLNAADTHACVKCGSKVASQQRVTDSMIVAHAAKLPEVTHLYTYDAGILEFAKAVRPDLAVTPPPNPNGPLFEPPSKVVPIRKAG